MRFLVRKESHGMEFNMANAITEIQMDPVSNDIVATTSRYANSILIYWGPKNLITFKTYTRKSTIIGPQDRFVVITSRYQYRPDLISSMEYGAPDFWWKIMEYNNMKDIMEFTTGKNIVLPANVLF